MYVAIVVNTVFEREIFICIPTIDPRINQGTRNERFEKVQICLNIIVTLLI